MRLRVAVLIGALLLGAAALGADRLPWRGMQVGEGRLVADEKVYPGLAGPVLGEVVTSGDDAVTLWEAVGFSAEPPQLDGQALVVVAGGQPADCRWRLDDVRVDEDGVRLTLAFASRWRNLVAGTWCDGAWEPRALAVTVPAGGVVAGADVELVLPWGDVESATRVEDRQDPSLWESRMLSADELDQHHGCEDAVIFARTADDAVVVWTRWPGAASRTREDGRFEDQVSLPSDDVPLSLQVGGYASAALCTDVVQRGRPLPAGRWHATAGEAEITVEMGDGDPPTPRASLTLRDVEFQPLDRNADGPWWLPELVVPDVPVGWYAG